MRLGRGCYIAQPSMLKTHEQLHGIKFGLQTLNFAVVFLLELRDKPVELIPPRFDLLIKHFGPLLQVATNVAHLMNVAHLILVRRSSHAVLKPSREADTGTSLRRAESVPATGGSTNWLARSCKSSRILRISFPSLPGFSLAMGTSWLEEVPVLATEILVLKMRGRIVVDLLNAIRALALLRSGSIREVIQSEWRPTSTGKT